MKIGGEYRVGSIAGRHWERLARDNDLDPVRVVARVACVATSARGAINRVVANETRQGLDPGFGATFNAAVTSNAESCLAVL